MLLNSTGIERINKGEAAGDRLTVQSIVGIL